MNNTPKFLIVDLFCGAGGTTTGFDMATENGQKLAEVMACVNHDAKAIKSHWLNHPNVEHYEEDITKMYGAVQSFRVYKNNRWFGREHPKEHNAAQPYEYDTYNVFFKSPEMVRLERLVDIYRACYPEAKVILWASLECTNFSKAKGGQPRDADSRTLADHLDRYINVLNPDYVQIENVVEFMSWGPLDKNGKPVSRKAGSDWMRWRTHINSLGYYDQWRELNSADFGAYTSRNRLFGCFAKHDLPIAWPDITHAKKPIVGNLFGPNVRKWKAVKDVLDFEDEGESIFTRKKELSPKTLERIYAGLIKYVAGGQQSFLVKWNSANGKGRYNAPSINEPCPVVSTQNRLGMCFIAKSFSGRPAGKVIPITGPAGTITTVAGQSLVQCYLFKYYGNGHNISSQDEPAGTVTTKDRFTKVWIDRNFKTGGNSSVENPVGALLTVPKCNLITAEPFILNGNFGHSGPVGEPSPTLTASRRHHYIVNPSHGGHSTSVDAPCPVIIARQDKAPLYLIDVEHANVFIPIYDDEPKIMVSIKEFMSLYSISDIKMRMLKVLELLKIQGFPDGYHLAGNQSDQKKFIGNSVVPHVVRAWCEAMGMRLFEERFAA